tara:strand:- start:7327 stop:7587 length:261 start_codon:yes stop_codon:yes gene_type:complete
MEITIKEQSVQEMYIVRYNDIYGNGNDQKLEVVLENRNHFLEWLEQHNDNRKMDYISDEDFIEEREEEFDIIPLNVYVPKFKKNNQ